MSNSKVIARKHTGTHTHPTDNSTWTTKVVCSDHTQ